MKQYRVKGVFASKLAELRRAARLTQAEMGAITEIPTRTIENWESGERTPPSYVQRLVLNELRLLEKEEPPLK